MTTAQIGALEVIKCGALKHRNGNYGYSVPTTIRRNIFMLVSNNTLLKLIKLGLIVKKNNDYVCIG